jgi:hypothetical protein
VWHHALSTVRISSRCRGQGSELLAATRMGGVAPPENRGRGVGAAEEEGREGQVLAVEGRPDVARGEDWRGESR